MALTFRSHRCAVPTVVLAAFASACTDTPVLPGPVFNAWR
jgi:hypothetical protein